MLKKLLRITTLQQLNSALADVRRDLIGLGFFDEKLADVDVYLVPFSRYLGYQWYGSDRSINIPAVSLDRILESLYFGSSSSLRDVLRHEYAHALADTHRKLIRTRAFSSAFGAPHGFSPEWEYDSDVFVSTYAATCPMEDFAETFMEYVWRKGKLPKKWAGTSIEDKWSFITTLRKQIQQSK